MTSHTARPATILLVLSIQTVLGLSLLILPSTRVLLLLPAAGIMTVVFLKPRYGYMLYLFLLGMPITVLGEAGPAGLRIRPADMVFASVLIGFLVTRMRQHGSAVESTPFVSLVIILYAWMFLSVGWVKDYTWLVASAARRFYCLAIFLLTISIIDTERMLRKTYVVWIVLGTTVAVLGIFELVFFKAALMELGRGRVHWAALRAGAAFHTSHVLAMILSFSGFLVFAHLQTVKELKFRVILFCSACVTFLGLLGTYSKSILYGFVAGCIPFAYVSMQFRRRVVKMVIVAIVVTIPVAGGRFLETLLVRHGYIFEHGMEQTIPRRMKLWSAVWESVMDHPLLGVGLGGFRSIIPEYDPTSTTTPHNLYLFFVTEFGIVGLLILVTTLFYGMSRSFYIIRNTDNAYFRAFGTATFAAMTTYGVAAMALSYSLAEYIFWAFLGLHCVTLRHASKYLKV